MIKKHLEEGAFFVLWYWLESNEDGLPRADALAMTIIKKSARNDEREENWRIVTEL